MPVMNSMKNTYVTLKTEKFNVSESKEYFIYVNPAKVAAPSSRLLCNTLLREAPSVLASVNTLILVSELTQISNRSLVFMYRRAGMV